MTERIEWKPAEWRAACATFRLFEQMIPSRSMVRRQRLEYVNTNSVAAASGVSAPTARRALNRLVDAGVLMRIGGG